MAPNKVPRSDLGLVLGECSTARAPAPARKHGLLKGERSGGRLHVVGGLLPQPHGRRPQYKSGRQRTTEGTRQVVRLGVAVHEKALPRIGDAGGRLVGPNVHEARG